MTAGSNHIKTLKFDDIVLDLENRQIWREGRLITLSSKYFDVLAYLVKRHGQLTTKNEIFEAVWGDVIVSDSTLSQGIKEIRRQLGDNAAQPRYIKTVPKHGYMFIPEPQTATGAEMEHIATEAQERVFQTSNRPYKFLDYFTENDSNLFFGREWEVQQIISKILAHRSFIIHGRSGVGKSSIIRAGIIPRLKEGKHRNIAVIRSYSDPVAEMVEACKLKYDNNGMESESNGTIFPKSYGTQSASPCIYFFDQFEDFFILLQEHKRRAFIHFLKGLFDNEERPVKCVFILREDLLAEMSVFKEVIPEIFHNEFRLKRLTTEQATRAICEPARRFRCPMEQGLVARVLEDLNDNGYVDPPQLQIVCDALFDARDAERGLTLEEYHQLGGASRILAEYLERVLHRFGAEDFKRAKQILSTLISGDKQRIVVRTSEIKERIVNGQPIGEDHIERLLEELSSARIIRFRRQDGDRWVELAHDFLINEVVRWQSAEEFALKRARAVIERAVENYRTHELLIDSDTLDLILSYGDRLNLTVEESEVLIKSLLNCSLSAPTWLVNRCPTARNILEVALKDSDPRKREAAAASMQPLLDDQRLPEMLHLAFRDRDLLVRKAASIAIAYTYPSETERLLAAPKDVKKPGIIRRAISLAFVRDHDKTLIHLAKLPVLIVALVVSGLGWVRLRRSKRQILNGVFGAVLGGGFSGVMVGGLLGGALAWSHSSTFFESGPVILVMIHLGLLTGVVGGFGISLGMISIAEITYRHSHWWSVFGGMAGGTLVGGAVHILGVDTMRALFGQNLSEIAGAPEGALMGACIALGSVFVGDLLSGMRVWQRALGGAFGGAVAAVILTLLKGNLFSGSIEVIARSFSQSQIRMETLARLFGEVHYGTMSRLFVVGIEGFLFGGLLIAGLYLFLNRVAEKT